MHLLIYLIYSNYKNERGTVLGSYNSQYESYYEKMFQKRRNADPYKSYFTKDSFDTNKEKNIYGSNYFMNRILRDLIGVAVLFLMVLFCKYVHTPQTAAVYNYSKGIVSKNYDYKYIYNKIKSTDIEEIKKSTEKKFESIKIKLTKAKKLEDIIKDNFIPPVKGEITSGFGMRKDPFTGEKSEHTGIDIDAKENTKIKASGDGIVKECKEDKLLGKYIIMDHGKGIETKYAHLSNIMVKKGEKIKKGEYIAESGNTGRSTAPHLHFEIIYMGQCKNPLDYFEESAFKN